MLVLFFEKYIKALFTNHKEFTLYVMDIQKGTRRSAKIQLEKE